MLSTVPRGVINKKKNQPQNKQQNTTKPTRQCSLGVSLFSPKKSLGVKGTKGKQIIETRVVRQGRKTNNKELGVIF